MSVLDDSILLLPSGAAVGFQTAKDRLGRRVIAQLKACTQRWKLLCRGLATALL